MVATATYGRKPGTVDSGWGVAQSGWMRGSNMGAPTYDGWIIKFGFRGGKPSSGSANATGDVAIYTVTGSNAAALLGEMSGTVTVSAVMSSAGGGSDYEKAPAAPVKRPKNAQYVLAVRSAANTFHFGQDLSGHFMHKRNGVAASFPNPYAATSVDHEGKISVWAIEVPNTAPLKPSNVSPPAGGSTTDTTPTIAADFRDAEEILPGFALGQGDQLKSFRVVILNADKSATIHDSGIVNSDSTMRTNRRSTYTVPALSSATYVAQVIHLDQFDAPSPPMEWTFTVGAASLDVDLNPANVAIADPLRTTAANPGYAYTWHHSGSANLTNLRISIRQMDTGAIVLGPYAVSGLSVPVNTPQSATGSVLFAAAGWAALTRGKSYRYEIAGSPDGSSWSQDEPSPWFIVNKPPDLPVNHSPHAGQAFVGYPVFSIDITDADDPSDELTPHFLIRPYGVGSGSAFANAPQYLGNNRWAVQSTSADITGLGNWEWAVYANDPSAANGSQTGWQAIYQTTPPTITWTNPDPPNESFTTGTPTLTWTVDRTQSSFQLTIYRYAYSQRIADVIANVLYGTPIPPMPVAHRSPLVASGVGSYAVPAGVLKNNQAYTIQMDVNTSDGLRTGAETYFNVDYVERVAPTGLSITAIPGPFEPNAAQYSTLLANWNAIGTAGPGPYASDADFASNGGYEFGYRLVGSETDIVLATMPTRTDNRYEIRTARSGEDREYFVRYRYSENLEVITSAEATVQASLILENTVISDMRVGGGSVPIRYWESAGGQDIGDEESIVTFGPKPISFRGVLSYTVWEMDFELFTDEFGTFTATDLLDGLRALKAPDLDADNLPIPKTLCFREPALRTVIYGNITDLTWDKDHTPDHITGRLVFTEHAVEDDTDI